MRICLMALFIFILFLKLELLPLSCMFQGHEISVSLLCNFFSLLPSYCQCYFIATNISGCACWFLLAEVSVALRQLFYLYLPPHTVQILPFFTQHGRVCHITGIVLLTMMLICASLQIHATFFFLKLR